MIKLGVPSKGRLMQETFAWFSARGVHLSKSGSDREYVGRVDGVAGVE
jgi:ATP phosphoribosyltransferase